MSAHFGSLHPLSSGSAVGKVPDLMPLYASSDLQVAASTEATGLRTRVVESFAFGLPVLSTTAASRGVAGIRSGENIVLADTPDAWVQALESILESPAQLSRLARNARATYDTMHSSAVAAAALDYFLAKYFSIGSLDASRARAHYEQSARGLTRTLALDASVAFWPQEIQQKADGPGGYSKT